MFFLRMCGLVAVALSKEDSYYYLDGESHFGIRVSCMFLFIVY